MDINVAAQPNQAEDGRDEEGIPELESGSLEFSHIADYEDMPELMDEISEEAMEEERFKRNFNFGFDYRRAPNGPRKEYTSNHLDSSEVQTQAPGDVQHRQEQEAQDYAVSEKVMRLSMSKITTIATELSIGSR